MRTIKFRAWDKETKSFLPNSLWCVSPIGSVFVSYGKVGLIKKEDIVLMQFTGLFDCKGKEIYEGDIVKYTNCTGDKEIRVVEYMSDYDAGFFPFTSCSCGDVKATDPEIIGNIYENLELL